MDKLIAWIVVLSIIVASILIDLYITRKQRFTIKMDNNPYQKGEVIQSDVNGTRLRILKSYPDRVVVTIL